MALREKKLLANANGSHYHAPICFPLADSPKLSHRMNNTVPTIHRADPGDRGPGPSARRRMISSRELLGDQLELLIEHQGAEYRLRLTRQGKLILTK